MKARTIALGILFLGFLATSYLLWAQHRVTPAVLTAEGHLWPRPWPHPDRWLVRWEMRIGEAQAKSLSTLAISEELPLLRQYLTIGVDVSLAITLGAFIWWLFLRSGKGRATPAVHRRSRKRKKTGSAISRTG